MDESRDKLVEECRHRLMKKKEEILNGLRSLDDSLTQHFGGDEADMAQTFMEQSNSLAQRDRMNQLIKEIDEALQRIENRVYGICEVTEEPIEPERLKAMPWTRLSLTGAEEREAQKKRFA